METLRIVIPILGLTGLATAMLIFRRLLAQPAGEGRVAEISAEIRAGAMVFMRRELRLIGSFALVVGGLLFFKDHWEAMSFFLGALSSSVAGYIGMKAATNVNVRTAVAAHESGPGAASVLARWTHRNRDTRGRTHWEGR